MTKQAVVPQAGASTQPAPFDAVEFIKKHATKSGAIRALAAEGNERKVIAKLLGIRYQHVRNVLITPIKK